MASIWKGHLTFGLLSIPVRLHRAARKERVQLHYVHSGAPAAPDRSREADGRDGGEQSSATPAAGVQQKPIAQPGVDEAPVTAAAVSRVRQDLIRETDRAPIERRELSKGYEYEPDRYVVIDKEELRKLRPKTSPEMQISQFVRLAEIDPVYFETSYYVLPEGAGEKAYAVLFAVLKKTAYVALAGLAMHGREHIVIVRAGRTGLIAHTIYYTGEIRGENEFRTNEQLVSAKELELASAFVQALSGSFEPDNFKDTYREQLRSLIEGKAARQGAAPTAPARATASPVDIMEALKSSLARAKKPEAAPVEPARKAPGKLTELRKKPQRRKA